MKFDFEKIKSSIAKTMIKTKETSSNMVEVAKAKYKLSEIQSDINDKYIDIGKIVYRADENDSTERIEAICNEITELKSKADDLQAIIDDIMNKNTCEACGEKVDKKYTYCPKCGNSFND
ncbi:MAG: hypothetical protein E7394_02230 [Ruminococcaceae bacterium]|nr:hypothetical protein [Oscillospiraceae bacterium]